MSSARVKDLEWRLSKLTILNYLLLPVPLLQMFVLLYLLEYENRQITGTGMYPVFIIIVLVTTVVALYIGWRVFNFVKDYRAGFYSKTFYKRDGAEFLRIIRILDQMNAPYVVKNKWEKYPTLTRITSPKLVEIPDHNLVIFLEDYQKGEHKVRISIGKRTDGNESFIQKLQGKFDSVLVSLRPI